MEITDPIVLDALDRWNVSVKRRTDSKSNFYPHCEIALVKSNTAQERVESTAAFKSRVPFKRSRIMANHAVENDMAIRDICISIALKRAFIDYADRMSYDPHNFYYWLMSYGIPKSEFDVLVYDYTISADYKTVSKNRIVFTDKRGILNSNDVIYCKLAMTSGFVPAKCVTRCSVGDKKSTFGFPKPIMNMFATVPSDETKLWTSQNKYSMKKCSAPSESFSDIVDRCYVNKVMRRVNCMSEMTDTEFLDLKMVHTDECYGEKYKHVRKSYHRLWFINKIPTLSQEYDRLFAKWQRRAEDVSFFICKHCDDTFPIHNYHSIYCWDQDLKMQDKMVSFCSYYCYNAFISSKQKYERVEEIRLGINLCRMFCPACQASCYLPHESSKPADAMGRFFDSWRWVKVFDNCFNFESLVCSDDCEVFLRRRIADRQQFTMGRNNLVKAMVTCDNNVIVRDTTPSLSSPMFRFYTCFNCCRILHPGLKKICHFKNFPRIAWAYTCYDAECVFRFLMSSMPIRLFHDELFFSSASTPAPSSLPSAESSCLDCQNTVSSGSGHRFTLTIFE